MLRIIARKGSHIRNHLQESGNSQVIKLGSDWLEVSKQSQKSPLYASAQLLPRIVASSARCATIFPDDRGSSLLMSCPGLEASSNVQAFEWPGNPCTIDWVGRTVGLAIRRKGNLTVHYEVCNCRPCRFLRTIKRHSFRPIEEYFWRQQQLSWSKNHCSSTSLHALHPGTYLSAVGPRSNDVPKTNYFRLGIL